GELEAFLSQRDEEMGRLKGRIGELEVLGGQMAERDAKLREWEAKFNRLVSEKDDEVGKLRWRVSELEASAGQRDAQFGELETRYRGALSSTEQKLAQL